MIDKTLVSVVMPNEKDYEIMNESIKTLQSLKVPCEVSILSAHRSPFRMIEYIKDAQSKGIEVIIATASGAAHLPGMVAAFTTLPVIAVPLKSTFLDGLDSMLSMLQMPSGVPVATVSINGARNAAILAAQILSLHYSEINASIENLKITLSEEVELQNKNIKSQNTEI